MVHHQKCIPRTATPTFLPHLHHFPHPHVTTPPETSPTMHLYLPAYPIFQALGAHRPCSTSKAPKPSLIASGAMCMFKFTSWGRWRGMRCVGVRNLCAVSSCFAFRLLYSCRRSPDCVDYKNKPNSSRYQFYKRTCRSPGDFDIGIINRASVSFTPSVAVDSHADTQHNLQCNPSSPPSHIARQVNEVTICARMGIKARDACLAMLY
jgi:hypothetical protein